MAICPNCNEQVDDGASFCGNCGAKIVKTASVQEYGTEIGKAEPFENKKKKFLMIGGLAVTSVIVAAIALVLFVKNGMGDSTATSEDYAFYIKNNELVSYNAQNGKSMQITTHLLDAEIEDLNRSTLASLGQMCSNGEYLCFVDNYLQGAEGGESDRYTLYYKEIGKKEAEAVKIADNVIEFKVDKERPLVVYSDTSWGLYQYDIETDETIRIDGGQVIEEFRLLDGANKILYSADLNTDAEKAATDLYLKYEEEETEKLASNVSQYETVNEGKTIFYLAAGTLYRMGNGEEPFQIASDVERIVRCYDSGAVYYTKARADTNDEMTLFDCIYDDMEESDASLTEPEYPEWDWEFYFDDLAYEEYENEVEEYEEAMDRYEEKEKRDRIREWLSGIPLTDLYYFHLPLQLCYFDGTESVIAKSLKSGTMQASSDHPLAHFEAYDETELERVTISDLYDMYADSSDFYEEDVITLLNASYDNTAKGYVVIKNKVDTIENNNAHVYWFDRDGKTIYFFGDNIKEQDDQDLYYGDLYKVEVSENGIGSPELYDTDVFYGNGYYCMFFYNNDYEDYKYASYGYSGFISEGQLAYFKNVTEDRAAEHDISYGERAILSGELYVNRTKIDDNVRITTDLIDFDNGRMVYYTNYNDEKERGTLKVCENDEVKEIDADVHSYCCLPTKEILYLRDYSLEYAKGDLYTYKEKESIQIDQEVQCICYPNA